MAGNKLSNVPRDVVEELVRRAIYARVGRSATGNDGCAGTCAGGGSGRKRNPLVVNVSARHCHLTQAAVEQLFGPGHQLTPMKWLYQDGQFAAKEAVTLIGPRSRVISNLRILGPCRTLNQVELSYTDAIALGYEVPLRSSGDIAGSTGCMLMGPAGYFEMPEGVIRAKRHVHMHPDDASQYGVEAGGYMKLRIGGECGLVLENMLVRVDPSFKLEVHIDTDEGNACALRPDSFCDLLK